jgi:hypothetical protein
LKISSAPEGGKEVASFPPSGAELIFKD